MKKLLILVVIFSFTYLYGQSDNAKYWLGNNSNGEVTNSEVTSLAQFADSLDDATAATISSIIQVGESGLTSTEADILDGATVVTYEVNGLDISTYWQWVEEFVGTNLDTVGDYYAAGTVGGTNAHVEGWKAAGDAGWTLTQAAGTLGGILRITTLTGSNNEFYTQLGELGTETYVEFLESGKKVWSEFRLADTDVTSSAANFFVGFAEEGSAAANFIADAGNDIADKDVVGFVQWEANDDTISCIYQTAGGAFVDTFETAITTAQMRLAITFDGDSTISFYKDGTLLGTVEDDATGFPSGEELSPIIGVKQGAQDRVLDIDYIRIIQER